MNQVFSCLQDLLHTTKCQNALFSEQAQLQKDVSKWTARLESCRSEAETKEQQLQGLRDELRENRLRLDQQEMVLRSEGSLLAHGGGGPASHLPAPDQTARAHLLCDSV